jgi:hypothetical protein
MYAVVTLWINQSLLLMHDATSFLFLWMLIWLREDSRMVAWSTSVQNSSRIDRNQRRLPGARALLCAIHQGNVVVESPCQSCKSEVGLASLVRTETKPAATNIEDLVDLFSCPRGLLQKATL